MPHRVSPSPVMSAATLASSRLKMSQEAVVAQALMLARDSPDGAEDPVVCEILNSALKRTWDKVQEAPRTYVMTRNEFAVFNYFQHRFVGNTMAVAARKRFWDHEHA
ncbi:hypothetical protein L249_8798 [Ophiocordyceps polyrhachis-furcata BCC 54312]|uniref:Uncharacterized protein n=1 Tax=Ophiocordyceps polyrhachis-furcata BCC 54312 TaxID=1330021 RepID=A0A367L207_9HYPO|nr:hypothetical protein L249_8798 [Ophiocordyceps polyrhachis-furcata BCC 54312]